MQSSKKHVNTSFFALQKGCKRGAKGVQNTSKRVQNANFHKIFTNFHKIITFQKPFCFDLFSKRVQKGCKNTQILPPKSTQFSIKKLPPKLDNFEKN